MQAACATTLQQAVLSRRPAARSHRLTVVVAAQQQQRSEGVTRREAGLAALAALAAFTSAAQPAQAIFGLGAKEATEKYEKSTAQVIADVRAAALLERGAPGREETMDGVRREINDWVSRYRRDTGFSGRASYGNTYSAVNAMAGHLNSFGAAAPVPKKRLERMLKELDDAEKLLARGR